MNNSELNINKKLRGSRFFAHLFALCILFFLPEVLFNIGKPMGGIMYMRPVTYILVFYLNYYYLVDKYFFEKNKRLIYFVINLLLVLGVVCGIYVMSRILFPMPTPKFMGPGEFNRPEPHHIGFVSHHALKMVSFLVKDGVLLILTIALTVAMKLGEKWVKWDNMQRDMIAERQENELKNLKNQLNPHFLFNTLNNIYSLISISPPKAQKSIHDLSNLLRYVLYDNNDKEVELLKDLKFINNYIELMRLRLTSNVRLEVNIQEHGIEGLKIAPLLFISLVENAFKHGISSTKPSFISIKICVDGGCVKCKVANSYFPKPEEDKSGSGIGLKNLERQLSIIYPSRYYISTTYDNETYSTVLNIELTQSDEKL